MNNLIKSEIEIKSKISMQSKTLQNYAKIFNSPQSTFETPSTIFHSQENKPKTHSQKIQSGKKLSP